MFHSGTVTSSPRKRVHTMLMIPRIHNSLVHLDLDNLGGIQACLCALCIQVSELRQRAFKVVEKRRHVEAQ
jgi:hypothetical protein